MLKHADLPWTTGDSAELYQLERWGNDYFSINQAGHLSVHPSRDPNQSIDLKTLIDQLKQQKIALPCLLRFSGILQDRVTQINQAFNSAIAEYEYKSRYSSIYPIKVNQQRHVVEEVLKFGKSFGAGLEVGSKAELLAVIAIADNHTPIICNGFKDQKYIEIALSAQKLGRNLFLVVENYSELDIILQTATRFGVRPNIGMRVKLASSGAGRWSSSGGYRSKFGLTVTELLQAVGQLKQFEMADCFKLLHYHQGSQESDIRQVKTGLIEAARIYAELVQHGAKIQYLDVGGGLGVDYDGSKSDKPSSINYSLSEYARDVVSHVGSVCDDAGVAHPHLLSESGRAIVAYHSMLVFDVLDVSEPGAGPIPQRAGLDNEPPSPLVELYQIDQQLNTSNVQASLHNAQLALDMALNRFSNGNLSLQNRSIVETWYWNICDRICELVEFMDDVPAELRDLKHRTCDTYHCNFSLFQSLPDSWAIEQLFPVMPIHRLDEKPDRHAVIADITCDSDGKIDHFIDHQQPSETLQLHALNDRPYHLAALLVGAYQESLGDLHNLFGATSAVQVTLDEQGKPGITHITPGDTVANVLRSVQLNSHELLKQLNTEIQLSTHTGNIDSQEAKQIQNVLAQGIQGTTYLEQL
ncbi:MAG: arginine decarboxylase [Blastopirellula sp.]|nr:MAG: arginine decarboxylase [Blastopirellula sp.]